MCLKGKGEKFKLWMKKQHPGFLLWNAYHVKGSRQDFCATGAYWNRLACIDFLDYLLLHKKKENKLEKYHLLFYLV